MTNEIGHARNTSPEDEMDARELVPEMMERLYEGKAVALLYSESSRPEKWNLRDYMESISGDMAVLSASRALYLLSRQDTDGLILAAVNLQTAQYNALRAECEKDTDYYAAACRAGYNEI